jgi:hypothetical protein
MPRPLPEKLFSRQVVLPAPRDEALEAALLTVDPTVTVLFTCDKFQAQQKQHSTPPPLPLDARSTSRPGTPYQLRPGWRLRLAMWWHDAGIFLAVVHAKVKEGVQRLRDLDLRAQWRSIRKTTARVMEAAVSWSRHRKLNELRMKFHHHRHLRRYLRRFHRIARGDTSSP